MRKVLSAKEVDEIKPENVHEILRSVMLADGFDLVVDLAQSHGVNLFDSKHRRWYIDFFSYFASAPLSHNHPKMNEPEFLNKLLRVAKTKPSNSDFYTVEFAQFVATFVRVLMTPEFKYLFFIDGGALAVENALKTAFDWKTRLLGKDQELDLGVIHFKDAFHGRTGYTLSLTNTADPRKYIYFTKFHWDRFEGPELRFPITDDVINEVSKKEAEVLEKIEDTLKRKKDNIAAIIIEPIQAEGGDKHFRGEFLAGLRELADRYDIMLIFDEVQTGCGLTGKRWAYEHFGVAPDIVAFGKKTQVCGIMVTERVDIVKD
ncbi:MAG: aminotransferase class III-fold pyridoxal phosphate-dependent enzyme, partial [bacterium]